MSNMSLHCLFDLYCITELIVQGKRRKEGQVSVSLNMWDTTNKKKVKSKSRFFFTEFNLFPINILKISHNKISIQSSFDFLLKKDNFLTLCRKSYSNHLCYKTCFEKVDQSMRNSGIMVWNKRDDKKIIKFQNFDQTYHFISFGSHLLPRVVLTYLKQRVHDHF